MGPADAPLLGLPDHRADLTEQRIELKWLGQIAMGAIARGLLLGSLDQLRAGGDDEGLGGTDARQ